MSTKRKIDLTDMKAVLLFAGICCFLWGSATPAIKTGYRLFQIDAGDTFSIILFAGIRFLLAGFLVILFHSVKSGSWIMPPRGAGVPIVKLSLAQTVLQYYFFYVGLSYATGVHGAIITGTNVFISILFASLIFRYEKLTRRKLVGCGLGFAGIVIMNLAGQASAAAYLLLLYLALISAVAYTLWGILLKYNPVSRVTVFGFMNPIFGVILSAIFLGESGQALSWNAAAALALVCAGIYVVNAEGAAR